MFDTDLERANSAVFKAKQTLKDTARSFERLGESEHADRIYKVCDQLDAIIHIGAEMEAVHVR